jgi:hypothetical protein
MNSMGFADALRSLELPLKGMDYSGKRAPVGMDRTDVAR